MLGVLMEVLAATVAIVTVGVIEIAAAVAAAVVVVIAVAVVTCNPVCKTVVSGSNTGLYRRRSCLRARCAA